MERSVSLLNISGNESELPLLVPLLTSTSSDDTFNETCRTTPFAIPLSPVPLPVPETDRLGDLLLSFAGAVRPGMTPIVSERGTSIFAKLFCSLGNKL